MGRAMLSKSLVQFSVERPGSVPSLLFDLRPNYGRVNGILTNSFKRTYVPRTYGPRTVVFSAPDPKAGHYQPMPLLETPGHSQASLVQSLVGSLLLSPGSWCTQGFVCSLQEFVSPVMWKFCNQIPLAFQVKFPEGSHSLCQIPGWEICCGP